MELQRVEIFQGNNCDVQNHRDVNPGKNIQRSGGSYVFENKNLTPRVLRR
jgi:hypothetical protein